MKKGSKIASVLTAFVLTSSLAATFGGCSSNRGGVKTYVEPDFSLDNRLTISWMIPTQQSVSIAEIPMIKHLEEKFNVVFELTELPTDQHEEKKRLWLANDQLPDFVSWVKGYEANEYGPSGAFVDLALYEKHLPNFMGLVNQAIEEEATERNILYNPDGQMFMTPQHRPDAVPFYDFSYNKNAFDSAYRQVTGEDGEAPMGTWSEVKSSLEKVKQVYNVAPYNFRNFSEINLPLSLFVESFTEARATSLDYVGYDYDKDELKFALEVDGYKEAIEFVHSLRADGLLGDYATLDEGKLVAKVKNNEVFMIEDFVGGWTGLSASMKNTGNKLVPLKMPVADGKTQVLGRRISIFNSEQGSVLNSKVTKDPELLGRLLLILDYMYSDEFFVIQNYHEDVAFDLGNGQYQYKDNVYDMEGDYTVLKDTYFPWSISATFRTTSDERPDPIKCADYLEYVEYLNESKDASSGLYKPFPNISFTQSEQKRINIINSNLDDIYKSTITDFIEGKKNFNADWNSFVSQMKNGGANDLIALYKKAYDRAKVDKE